MHLISLRKNFLLIALLIGLFSLFLQTQAFSCCWPWCCCYSGKNEKSRITVKSTERDKLINSERRDVYGTTPTLQPSFPQQAHDTSSLPAGQRQPSAVLTMGTSVVAHPVLQLPHEERLPSSTLSLVVPSRSAPPPLPGWYDDDSTFPRQGSRDIWTGQNTVFGVEQQMPPTFDRDIGHKFSTSTGWKTYPDERALDRFFGKVIHYALDDVQNNIALFLHGVKNQWKLSSAAFSFVYFSGSRYYYFFAKTDSQVMYIRMQLINGENDENTRASQPSTRDPSRMTSRQSSPKKEIGTSARKSTQNDDSD